MPEPKGRTDQEAVWLGRFGEDYTKRTALTRQGLDQLYLDTYGTTRRELNAPFLDRLPRDSRILEVGCNTGMQLEVLQEMGFHDLWAVELQWGAVDEARKRVPRANTVQASGFEIPFRDAWFDLVFTSGVLIHIAPDSLPRFMAEMHRTSRRYVWGFEYYAERFEEIDYRGNRQICWRGDYAGEFLRRHPDLRLVQKQVVPHRAGPHRDQMFLLEKVNHG